MAKFKIACPECGQKVSGDESFLGTVVDCPLCSTKIKFPKETPPQPEDPPQPEERPKDSTPPASESPAADKPAREIPAAPEPKTVPPASASAPAPAPATPAQGPAAPVLVPSAEATPRSKKAVRTSGAAIWSMIFGIAAVIFCPFGILFAIPAIIAGHSGRNSIRSSFGKVGGKGFATTGLALGYIYTALFLAAVLFVPWKALISMAEQAKNAESTQVILSGLTEYASDNEGKFPADLADLEPDYLAPGDLEKHKYIEPGSLPPEYLDFIYYPGHRTDGDPRTILLSAPDADRSYQRLVGYLDGSAEVISEEDFIRKEMKQRRE